jgi:hypothetical protein
MPSARISDAAARSSAVMRPKKSVKAVMGRVAATTPRKPGPGRRRATTTASWPPGRSTARSMWIDADPSRSALKKARCETSTRIGSRRLEA